MKLRRVSSSLLLTSVFLLVLSMLFTSPDLLWIAILPLLILAFPNIPFKIALTHFYLEGGERVGEPISVLVNIDMVGFGIIKAMHVLPPSFELLEGSNAKSIFVAGRGKLEIKYVCVPMKRGNYKMGEFLIEAENVFATRRVRKKLIVDKELEVKSRIYRIRRVETRRGVARRPIPEMDVSKVGVAGTDFREIRKYSYGDPVKFINWKATAKLGELMVNEFEREGKKAVWIFLDANPYMLHGDIRRNCFETAIEVAASLSYFFTTRGHRVGLYVVGHGITLYPESGRKQFNKIFSTLMRLDVAENEESFELALDKAKKYIEAVKPASIFITRAEYSNPVNASIRAMGRKKLPVSVITIKSVTGEDSIASRVVETMESHTIRNLRAAGINVMEVEAGKPVEKVVVGVAR